MIKTQEDILAALNNPQRSEELTKEGFNVKLNDDGSYDTIDGVPIKAAILAVEIAQKIVNFFQ